MLRANLSYTRLSAFEGEMEGAIVGAQNEGPLLLQPCPQMPTATCITDSQGSPVGAEQLAFENIEDRYLASLQLALPLSTWIFQLPPAIRAAQAGLSAHQASKDSDELAIQREAIATYFSWRRAQSAMGIVEASQARLEAQLKRTETLEHAGAAGVDDVARLRASLAQVEAQAAEVRAQAATVRDYLELLIGQAPEDLALTAHRSQAHQAPLGDRRALVAKALKRRPELAASLAGQRSQREAIKAEQAGYVPSLDLVGDLNLSNINPRAFPPEPGAQVYWSVGAQLSFDLNDTVVRGARVKKARQQLRQSQAQMKLLQRKITAEVNGAHHRLEAARSQTASSQREVVAATRGHDIISARHAEGQVTTTDLLSSESQRRAAQLRLADAQLSLEAAEYELRLVSGEKLEAPQGL